MPITISKHMGDFAAAHVLNHHDGGCANLHGHNYGVEVGITGSTQDVMPGNPESGMIIDFTHIKRIYKESVHEVLDHAYILPAQAYPEWYKAFCGALFSALKTDHKPDQLEVTPEIAQGMVNSMLGKVAQIDIADTTAEELARWIFDQMQSGLERYINSLDRPVDARIAYVKVWETPTSYAIFSLPFQNFY